MLSMNTWNAWPTPTPWILFKKKVADQRSVVSARIPMICEFDECLGLVRNVMGCCQKVSCTLLAVEISYNFGMKLGISRH